MTKKNFSLSEVVVISLLVFGFCVSANAQEQTYPSGKEFYPAVYGAFSEMHPNAKFLKIDFYNNSYTVTGVTGTRIGQGTSYDMTVRLTDSGEIETSYANTYQRIGRDSKWEFTSVGTFYNYKNGMNDVRKKILQIANNPADFSRYEKAAMGNIQFVYAILQDSTELAYESFIKTYIKESVFNISGQVSNVRDSNTEINEKKYKYVVTLSQKFDMGDEKSSSYLLALRDYSVHCRFYTDQDDVIRLTKTSVVKLQGRLTRISRGDVINVVLGVPVIYLDLIDVR